MSITFTIGEKIIIGRFRYEVVAVYPNKYLKLQRRRLNKKNGEVVFFNIVKEVETVSNSNEYTKIADTNL